MTKEWFPVPVAVDCPGCGAQTRSAAIVVGPTALVNDAGFKPDDDLLSKPWKHLNGYALVENLGGRTQNIERFIVDRFHASFVVVDGSLRSICQHCHDSLPLDSMRAAAMNGFVRLGARRCLLANEGLLIFSSHVELTEFRSGTTIEEDRLRYPDYALMLICDAESRAGETGTIELWHSIARGDYALIIKGHTGQEMLRDGMSDDLASAVAFISDLGLVVTELHLARSASPFCSLARDLFIDALIDAGYGRETQE